MVKKTTVNFFLTVIRSHFWLILLCLIMVLGGYLRLWRIADYMTFLGDEGRDALVVKRMIVDHKFTLLGPTASVGGFFLGPIYYYFMVPFLWLFNLNPVGPAVMVGIFGTATIFVVYLLGKKIFNTETGIIASLLYAVSPVVINYSHSSWNPNLVPFFASLFILVLGRIDNLSQKKEILLLGMLMGIGLQLHYLFLFLGVSALIYLYKLKNKISLNVLSLFMMGFILMMSPFIIFEFRHGFTNTQMILRFIFTSNDTGFNLFHFITTIWDVTSRLFMRLVVNNDKILTLIVMIITGYGLFSTYKTVGWKKLKLTILWLIIPLILFGLYKKPIYDYYFGIFFPLPFLLAGNGFSRLIKKRKITYLIAILFLCYIVLINWRARPFVYEPNQQLKQTREASQFVLEKAGGKKFNFALITDHNSDHAYRYFFEILKGNVIAIENPIIDPERKTVSDQLLIICESRDCQPLGNSLWDVAGFGRGEIAGKWQTSVLTVYKLIHYKNPS